MTRVDRATVETRILAALDEHGTASVDDLVPIVGVSPSTVRTTLGYLAGRGLVRRIQTTAQRTGGGIAHLWTRP